MSCTIRLTVQICYLKNEQEEIIHNILLAFVEAMSLYSIVNFPPEVQIMS